MKKLFFITTIFLSIFVLKTTAKAAVFESSPATKEFKMGCDSSFDIYADTSGINSNAADIEVRFNPAEVNIVDADSSTTGTQVKIGNAYQTYVYNDVDSVNGIIKVAAMNFMTDFNGRKVFMTINFQSKPSVTSTNFVIYFISANNSLDSNIADSSTSLDLLTSVVNANFTFTSGACVADTAPPNVNFVTPYNNQSGVALDSNVRIDITDNQSGVDLANTVIEIAGESYDYLDPEVTYTGNPLNYQININPRFNFPSGSTVIITVRTQDIDGNYTVRAISFNHPPAVPLRQCGQSCDVSNTCESGFECNNGICKLPSCVAFGDEDCTCTAPEKVTVCDANTVIEQIPVVSTITEFISNTGIPELIPQPIKELSSEVSAPGVTGGFISLGLLTNLLLFLLTLGSPKIIMLWLIGLFQKNKAHWGRVYDEDTKKPIAYANILAYMEGNVTQTDETISNPDGLYGFDLFNGKYKLVVNHPQYLTTNFTDILVPSDSAVVNMDLSMTKVQGGQKFSISSIIYSINRFISKISFLIILVGFGCSVAAVIVAPMLFNYLLLLLYTIILLISYAAKGRSKN